jgi:hypothetical protein
VWVCGGGVVLAVCDECEWVRVSICQCVSVSIVARRAGALGAWGHGLPVPAPPIQTHCRQFPPCSRMCPHPLPPLTRPPVVCLLPPAIRLYLFQIASALAYMHKRSYVHGDVKLENILIYEEDVVRLCDFGQPFSVALVDFGQPLPVALVATALLYIVRYIVPSALASSL